MQATSRIPHPSLLLRIADPFSSRSNALSDFSFIPLRTIPGESQFLLIHFITHSPFSERLDMEATPETTTPLPPPPEANKREREEEVATPLSSLSIQLPPQDHEGGKRPVRKTAARKCFNFDLEGEGEEEGHQGQGQGAKVDRKRKAAVPRAEEAGEAKRPRKVDGKKKRKKPVVQVQVPIPAPSQGNQGQDEEEDSAPPTIDRMEEVQEEGQGQEVDEDGEGSEGEEGEGEPEIPLLLPNLEKAVPAGGEEKKEAAVAVPQQVPASVAPPKKKKKPKGRNGNIYIGVANRVLWLQLQEKFGFDNINNFGNFVMSYMNRVHEDFEVLHDVALSVGLFDEQGLTGFKWVNGLPHPVNAAGEFLQLPEVEMTEEYVQRAFQTTYDLCVQRGKFLVELAQGIGNNNGGNGTSNTNGNGAAGTGEAAPEDQAQTQEEGTEDVSESKEEGLEKEAEGIKDTGCSELVPDPSEEIFATEPATSTSPVEDECDKKEDLGVELEQEKVTVTGEEESVSASVSAASVGEEAPNPTINEKEVEIENPEPQSEELAEESLEENKENIPPPEALEAAKTATTPTVFKFQIELPPRNEKDKSIGEAVDIKRAALRIHLGDISLESINSPENFTPFATPVRKE